MQGVETILEVASLLTKVGILLDPFSSLVEFRLYNLTSIVWPTIFSSWAAVGSGICRCNFLCGIKLEMFYSSEDPEIFVGSREEAPYSLHLYVLAKDAMVFYVSSNLFHYHVIGKNLCIYW